MSSLLDIPEPPSAPASRIVKPMGEDDMPEEKKRRGRPPKNADASPPKKGKRRGRPPGRKKTRRPYRKIAEQLSSAPPSGRAFTQHVKTTFAALRAVLDLEDCDEQLGMAFRSHEEAVALLP